MTNEFYEKIPFKDPYIFCRTLQKNHDITKRLIELITKRAIYCVKSVKILNWEGVEADVVFKDSLGSSCLVDIMLKDFYN